MSYGREVNILLGLVGGFVSALVLGLRGLSTTNLIGNLVAAVVSVVLLMDVARGGEEDRV